MDPDTFRGDIGVDGPEVYWRRRVAVLVGVLVVVAVVAWACSSASGGLGAGTHAKPGKSSGPTAAPRTDQTAARPGAAPPPSPEPEEPCRGPDLVLSLHAESRVYAAGRTPSFLLTVVNTGHLSCAVDLGRRAVETMITSGGDRIWSTTDCVSGPGRDMHTLRRGVPHVTEVRWDRRRSGPDCHSERPRARPGTYVATARLGALRSHELIFHLR
ncbi:hypothetical protein ABGB17_30590 [Sphaerisporangium sp. B11E5]|uniref:hypothetical protein n=1 Tax=Sphaerisporangium sp. B11E5 TaxID=3153563 RepID=UPI00325E1343